MTLKQNGGFNPEQLKRGPKINFSRLERSPKTNDVHTTKPKVAFSTRKPQQSEL